MEQRRTKIIISGGGTGGHIFPALSIADSVRELEPDADILFVGALGKMEMERVPAAGYPIIGLPVAGLVRKLSPANLTLPFKLWKSMRMARRIVREFRPDVAVGVGGYASGPLVRAAARAGIPCLLQEQNSYAGLTNRMLAPRASRICVAYEGMERFFPADRILLTGNPIRSSIRPADETLKQEARTYFGLDGKHPVLLVLGGSLGCRTLNETLKAWTREMKEDMPYRIIWQSGKYYGPDIRNFFASLPGESTDCELHPESGDEYTLRYRHGIRNADFIRRMDLAFAAADLVVSRAGAGTISELCAAGKATLFVPSPAVAEDHQTCNARALVSRQAAEMIPDAEAPEKLRTHCETLLRSPERLAELSRNILALARPDAGQTIAREVLALVRRTPGNKQTETL